MGKNRRGEKRKKRKHRNRRERRKRSGKRREKEEAILAHDAMKIYHRLLGHYACVAMETASELRVLVKWG